MALDTVDTDYIRHVGASWDGPDSICHEGYKHWYVDNEIVAAARQREVFGAALDSIVEHLHPTVGKADNDEVYETGSAHKEEDRLLFSARFRLYGPPPRRVPPLRRLLRRSRLLLNRS